MSMREQIESILINALHPKLVDVVDESHQHSVPAGSESHFKVTIVSSEFAEQTLVKRHQQVYGLLQEPLQGSVHALALHTFTPEEWARKGETSPESPDCRGGGRRDSV